MSEAELRSTRFRKDREASWRRLEGLVNKADRRRSLTPPELREFAGLYRAAISSLSVARAISLDRSLSDYLEALCARAYLVLYAPRTSFPAVLGEFFQRSWPRSVRALASLSWIAFAVMAAGAFAGWYLVHVEPGYYSSIVPHSLQQGRTPIAPVEELRASLYPDKLDVSGSLSALAAFLFRNNASVAVLSFGLGIALGIPTLLLMFYNGTVVGAFFALFAQNGLAFDAAAWLSVHGTTEIFAIVLSAGAGLAIARGFLLPQDRETRYASVAREGAQAATVALGAVCMLFVAAFLEGFVRQIVLQPYLRLLIGTFVLALWTCYFGFAGREERRGETG